MRGSAQDDPSRLGIGPACIRECVGLFEDVGPAIGRGDAAGEAVEVEAGSRLNEGPETDQPECDAWKEWATRHVRT